MCTRHNIFFFNIINEKQLKHVQHKMAYFLPLSKIHGADLTNNSLFDQVYLKTQFLLGLFWLDPAQKPLSHRPASSGQKGRRDTASGAFKPNQNQRLDHTLQGSLAAPPATTTPEKENLQASAWGVVHPTIEVLSGGGQNFWILLKVRSTHVYLRINLRLWFGNK